MRRTGKITFAIAGSHLTLFCSMSDIACSGPLERNDSAVQRSGRSFLLRAALPQRGGLHPTGLRAGGGGVSRPPFAWGGGARPAPRPRTPRNRDRRSPPWSSASRARRSTPRPEMCGRGSRSVSKLARSRDPPWQTPRRQSSHGGPGTSESGRLQELRASGASTTRERADIGSRDHPKAAGWERKRAVGLGSRSFVLGRRLLPRAQPPVPVGDPATSTGRILFHVFSCQRL